jgi:hypothetical protein
MGMVVDGRVPMMKTFLKARFPCSCYGYKPAKFRCLSPIVDMASPESTADSYSPSSGSFSYIGACNPPRKAKRSRFEVQSLPSPPSSIIRPLEPSTSSTTPHNAHHDDVLAPPFSRKRSQPGPASRKPSTLSRAAREAQRKMNHSLIEKARRTKINDALASLRSLIPREAGGGGGPGEEGDDKGTDKEFKLEILERAVTYLQELTSKVKELEAAGPKCKHCAGQRKRGRTEANDGYEADTDMDGSGGTPFLPPISSWLHLNPHSLPLTPNQSPLFQPSSSSKQVQYNVGVSPLAHLHVADQTPPMLTLPSPSLNARPSLEDESAATLLLQIAASSSSSSSSSSSASVSSISSSPSYPGIKPHTPSSFLGLLRDG